MGQISIRIKETETKEFDSTEAAEAYIRGSLLHKEQTIPTIFQIEVSGSGTLDVGIGAKDGIFLHFVREGLDPPYFVTQGQLIGGSVDYYLFGNHHTEILCEHLIGINEATKGIIHFLNTGQLLEELTWVEV